MARSCRSPSPSTAATARCSRSSAGRDIQLVMQRAVGARFGAGQRPDVPIQWLSDNGGMYTALDTLSRAERLNLVPITTPAASPQSNGMSEAFVNTLRRDYLAGADRGSAVVILDQLAGWIADYMGSRRIRLSGINRRSSTAPQRAR